MSKWLKSAFLAALLMGAGYLFGRACRQIGPAYQAILYPSKQLLSPLLWFVLGVACVAVTAGLVAALVRPVWAEMIAFALSGLTLLLGWRVSPVSGILALVYLIAASLYAVGVAKELNERIRFSVRPVGEGQGMLLMSLVLLACGSLYFGCAGYIEREGFSIPEPYLEMFSEQIEQRIMAEMPPEQREEEAAKLKEEFQRGVDEFTQRTIEPYERYIPFAVAGSLFMPLVTITRLLAWVPSVVLSILFPLLGALGFTETVSEEQEVERLVIR